MIGHVGQLIELFEDTRSRRQLSTLKPSEWAERHRIMTSDETPWPGPFSFRKSPYMREIVDRLSPNDPARKIAVMCGSQLGKSVNVIENGICWIISENPGNILFLTGHTDLSEEAIQKLDLAIDNCGLRSLIRPSSIRKKNARTGDTNQIKEFAGGKLVSGSASNHKMLRQRSVRYIFADDLEAAKKSSKASGNTRKLIDQRGFSYRDVGKTYYISTPETLEDSNIVPAFELGDQRYYFVPCPCCGQQIDLHWSIPLEGTDGEEMAGMTWKLDENDKLIPDSIGYICQKCGGFFDETHKTDINLSGEWIPTAEPSEPGFYSYHVSALYAPAGAVGWEDLVREWKEANPTGEKPKEDLLQTFKNLKLGLPYQQKGASPESKVLQGNIRDYEVGTIPEKLSLNDGNGRIVLLTCACDLNGTEDDARLDYEILAWSESGANYSVAHGSIGTFVPREGKKKNKDDRAHWTYRKYHERSVWPVIEKIIGDIYKTDTDRQMKIFITGVDYGYLTDYVYEYMDGSNCNVVGVRGDKESQYRKHNKDTKSFKPAQERASAYLLDVNHIKDHLAEYMKLKWIAGHDEKQQFGFMNFPHPSNGLYEFKDYFAHYESEHKVQQKSKTTGEMSYVWKKKSTNHQNHMWDVKIYGIALKDIVVDAVTREWDVKKGTWADYCKIILNN